ncbi:cytochrome P450 [Armillaria mellea]|nr:cytochrome P450 [Armillaria mellea]
MDTDSREPATLFNVLSSASLSAFALFVCLAFKFNDRWIGTKYRPDLPGPRGWPLIGNTILVFRHRNSMLHLLGKLQNSYGPLFTFTLPYWGRNIVINRPEWLEHVKKRDTLRYIKGGVVRQVFSQFPGPHTPVATDGNEWRSARRMMQPLFTKKSVTNHASEAMSKIIQDVINLLHEADLTNTIIDWNDLCGRLALTTFFMMAFNRPTNMISKELSCLQESDVIADSLYVLNKISANRLFNPLWSITDRLDGSWSAFHKAKSDLLAVIEALIAERLSLAANRETNNQDYLDTLLQDRSDAEMPAIRDTLMTLLLAGRDSTHNTLSWALYELLRVPHWIRRLREESSSNLASGQLLSYDLLSNFPNHLAVFYEMLRLWPGLPKNARLATEDDILPPIPAANLPAVKIAKGDFVLWSDYDMMRSPEIWGAEAARTSMLSDMGHELGMQLSTYEFVALVREILMRFNFEQLEARVRSPIDAFTPFMDGPFYVKVTAVV